MIEFVEESTHEVWTPQEVADYLRLDKKTVQKHYAFLGGIRIGSSYRFPREALKNAIQTGGALGGPGQKTGPAQGETVQDEERSQRLGGRSKKDRRLANRHGMLDD